MRRITHQVILVAGRPTELAYNHINQMSFRVASVEDLQAVWRNVKDEPGVTDLRGMDHGNAWSLYFRDPEGKPPRDFLRHAMVYRATLPGRSGFVAAGRPTSGKVRRVLPHGAGFRPIAEYQADVARKIGRDRP